MAEEWQPPNAEHPPPKAGEPKLHRAARVGDHGALRGLAEAGADLDEAFDIGLDPGARPHPATPLMVAAGSGDGADVETVLLLLRHGADPTLALDSGSAATFACLGLGWNYRTGGDAPRLQALLDAGAPLPTGGWAGPRTVASVAAAGDSDRLRILLEHGMSPDPIWDERQAAKDHRRMMEFIEAEIQPPLAKLARKGLGMTGFLGPPKAPYEFEIPLFEAARAGSVACLDLLAQAGAALEVRSADKPNALFAAGSAEVVRWLLAKGLDPKAVDAMGRDAFGALLESCGEEGVPREALAALLETGTDLGLQSKWPHTRLADAAFSRNAEAVELLLDLGVSVHPPDGCPTALHCDCWQGSSGDEDLEEGGIRIIDSLVAAGADLEALNEHGRTPMHEAAEGDWGYAGAIRALLRHGASPDPTDPAGVTPLMLAAEHGAVDCIRELLFAGADPSRKDRKGKSAIGRARAHLRTWKGMKAGRFLASKLVGKEQWGHIEADARRKAEDALALLEVATRP